MQVLNIAPRTFVVGFSREIKILLSKDEPISCLFYSDEDRIEV